MLAKGGQQKPIVDPTGKPVLVVSRISVGGPIEFSFDEFMFDLARVRRKPGKSSKLGNCRGLTFSGTTEVNRNSVQGLEKLGFL